MSNLIEIGSNSIYVDSVPGINKNAILTLYDLNYSYAPAPMKDGSLCADCAVLDYSSNNFRFNVTGFTTYSASSNSKLSVSVVDDNSKIIPDETVNFYANYTNRTSGASVNGSGIGCNISFDGSYAGMSFNSSSGLYYYNKSFADLRVRSYTQNYNVSCLGNALSYEDLNYSSSFDVLLNATLLTLGQSLEGVYEGASLVLGDVNNDSMIDLIFQGENDTTKVLEIYMNNGTKFEFNQSLAGYGARYGSLGLVDYDEDSDLDITQSGIGSLDYETRLFGND